LRDERAGRRSIWRGRLTCPSSPRRARKRPRPHVHGVEPEWGSKFWALGDDEESSDDEDMAESTLVEEAVAAGFTMEQIRLAEDELSSLASSSMTVSAKPREDSLSSKIVRLLWVANHQKKIKPWSGPLPPSRQSPLRTLGDAMAKAKVTPSKKGMKPYATKDCQRGCNILFGREASQLDPARNDHCNGSGKDAS
jgi:hypothetical protein